MHKKVGSGKYCWCPECKKAYHKEHSAIYEKNNREKRNNRFKTPEGRTKLKEKPSYLNQTERRREYHRLRYQTKKKEMRAKMDEWRAANLEIWAGYNRKRRALMKNAISAPYTYQEIYDRDNGICQLCLMPVTGSRPSIDHILPIALGGNDTPENVQLAHLSCNARKAHRV